MQAPSTKDLHHETELKIRRLTAIDSEKYSLWHSEPKLQWGF